jgi:putative Ca2+/H+ antiporter (TMEM165/GDT1 family)
VLGLWAAAAFAVTVGSKLLDYVPVRIVRRVTGLILLAFAGLSAYEALH